MNQKQFILHLSYSDSKGGGSIACYRIHKSILKNGKYISKILDSPIHEISYGRCNEITDSQGFTIADIVEVLPHSN